MTNPISIRVRRTVVLDELKQEASNRRMSVSALVEELIDEGLRTRRHPLVSFRNGETGRRACLVGGPDIWEVVTGFVAGDVPAADRLDRTAELLGIPTTHVAAALDYHAAFTSEIDAEIVANVVAAEEAESLWRRRQQFLTR